MARKDYWISKHETDLVKGKQFLFGGRILGELTFAREFNHRMDLICTITEYIKELDISISILIEFGIDK